MKCLFRDYTRLFIVIDFVVVKSVLGFSLHRVSRPAWRDVITPKFNTTHRSASDCNASSCSTLDFSALKVIL